MAKEFDLVVVGEINPDIILQAKDLKPEYGQAEKLIDDASFTIGASAVIVAAGAAKLGLKVAFVGLVADDLFAKYMLQEMQGLNIDVSRVVVKAELKSGFSIIFLEKNDRAIMTYAGSIDKLKYSDIDLSILDKAKHLHLSSFFLLKELRPDIPKLFKLAKSKALTTSLDSNWDPSNNWTGITETLKYTDIFLPNENEILALSKKDNISEAVKLLSEQVAIIALKLGEKGAIVKTKNKEISVEPIKVEVVDTTGAGDSFDAGFLHGFINGLSLEACLKQAVICGSLSTRAAGGTTAQANLEELKRLLA